MFYQKMIQFVSNGDESGLYAYTAKAEFQPVPNTSDISVFNLKLGLIEDKTEPSRNKIFRLCTKASAQCSDTQTRLIGLLQSTVGLQHTTTLHQSVNLKSQSWSQLSKPFDVDCMSS